MYLRLMVYQILKFLTKLTIWGYFRKVQIVGKEQIPKSGATIFIANHPSAFMDPIVVATSVERSLYFIAAGEYVGKGFKGWFFRHVLHMIPVFRPSTRPEDVHKNKNTFEQCQLHLLNQGALLIFPEGLSLTEKKLKPLKTGAARIAIGAVIDADFLLKVEIVPIGLNYSDPHTFRSDLFVNVGKPIFVNDFIDRSIVGDKELEIEAARRLTEALEIELQSCILHMESSDEELLLAKLEAVFSPEVHAQLNISYTNQAGEFKIQKDFIDAIQLTKTNSPTLFQEIEDKVDVYLNQLARIGLSDKDIRDVEKRSQKREFLPLILGSPLFIFGLLNNYIPYKGVGMISRRIKLNANFTGSIILAVGLFTFLSWYGLISFILGYFVLGWPAIFYPILMYISGVYALLYKTGISHSLKRKKLRFLMRSNVELIETLKQKRAEIIAVLLAMQSDYMARRIN